MSSTRPNLMLALACGAPCVAMMFGLALLVGAELSGSHPLSPGSPTTIPEAVAMGDAASVVRLVGAGADPNRRALVKAGFLGEQSVILTPAEAAVLSSRPAMLDLLRRHGLLSNDGAAAGRGR